MEGKKKKRISAPGFEPGTVGILYRETSQLTNYNPTLYQLSYTEVSKNKPEKKDYQPLEKGLRGAAFSNVHSQVQVAAHMCAVN